MVTTGWQVRGFPDVADKDIDGEFRVLLDALKSSIEAGCPVVIEVLGEPLWGAGVLPHYLHLYRPGILPTFPLHPTYAVVPFSPLDRYLVEQITLRVGDIYNRRKEAKWARYQERRQVQNDFLMEDWVARFPHWRGRLQNLTVPATAFLPIDTVTASGELQSGHRPVLGRRAERGGLRPSVWVPARRELERAAILRLAHADLLVANIQQTRGKQSLQTAKAALQSRPPGKPTLVVVDGPEQYVELGIPDILPIHRAQIFGSEAWSPEVAVSLVGNDRPQSEAMFDGAAQGLADMSAAAADLVRQAKSLWWYLRQRLQVQIEDRSIQRWFAQVDELNAKGFPEAGYFTALRRFITTQAGQRDVPLERKTAIESAICSTKGQTITALVRCEADRAAVVEGIGETLAATERDLAFLGVDVRLVSGSIRGRPDTLVLAGYFGLRSLQVVRRLKPRFLHIVADPAEITWLLSDIDGIRRHLLAVGGHETLIGYQRVADAAEQSARPWSLSTTNGLSLALNSQGSRPESQLFEPHQSMKPDEIAVAFTDGTVWVVPESTRVDVITPGRRGRFQVQRAKDLIPGDEVVVIDSTNQASFSQQLMTVLDETVLREEANLRKSWLGLAHVFRRTSVRSLHTDLVSKGIQASYATVRSWIPSSTDDDGTAIPGTSAAFLALASALGIGLPVEVLQQIYRAVRRIRAVHRHAGRALVRVIRSAYLGRLSPADMRYVETEWGMGLRELVNSAQLRIVDRVSTGRDLECR